MSQVDLKAGQVVNLKKVSELTEQTTVSATDTLPISDEAGGLKKITVENILSPVSGGVGNATNSTAPLPGVNVYNVIGIAGNYSNFLVSAGTPASFTTEELAESLWQLYLPQGATYWVKKAIPGTSFESVGIPGKNLFNKATINVGALDGNTGLPTVSANSRYSDYIEVTPGKKYTVSGRNTGTNPALVYYDSSFTVKTPPPYGTNWNGGPINGTYLISEGVKYIRMIVQFGGAGSADTVQFEEGDAATTYEAYVLNEYITEITSNALAAEYIKTGTGYANYKQIGLIETEIVPGTNLFDKFAITVGSLNASGGAPVTSPTSRISGWIPVEELKSYTISGRTGNQTLVTYDSNKVPTPVGGNFGLGPMNGTYTMPAGAAYVRFIVVFAGTGNVDTVQFQKGINATTYEPYIETEYVNRLNGLDILPISNDDSEVSRAFINQAVKYSNGELTIIGKYSKTKNVRIVMAEALANELFCVNSMFLIPNAGVITENDFIAGNLKEVLRGTSTDLIGPYILNGTNFVSGNHLAGSLKTAEMLSVNIYVDGVEIVEGTDIYDAKEVVVKVKTEVYDYTELINNSLEVVNFNEYHTYRIVDGKIEAIIEQVAVRNCSFTRLYGIQNVSVPDEPNIYVAHSAIKTTQAYVNTANYGTKATYPDVEKAIYSDTSSVDCVAVWLDLSRGLGQTQRVDTTAAAYLVATTKGYHVVIYSTTTPRTLNIGESMFYRGGYFPFENLSPDVNAFAYIQKDNVTGLKYLYVDFARTETTDRFLTISSPELTGKILEVTSADSTITITSDLFVLGDGVTIKSTGYGNIKVLIK